MSSSGPITGELISEGASRGEVYGISRIALMKATFMKWASC